MRKPEIIAKRTVPRLVRAGFPRNGPSVENFLPGTGDIFSLGIQRDKASEQELESIIRIINGLESKAKRMAV